MPAKQLKKYLRTSDNQLCGVLLAEKQGNTVFISWSKCCPKDSFSKSLADQIALGRLRKKKTDAKFPSRYKRQLASMVERCEHYFKLPIVVIEA